MATLHLEFAGKSTRVSLYGIPSAKPKKDVLSITSKGAVNNITVQNGLRKNLTGLTAQSFVDADPELDLASAGSIIERDQLSTAYIDPKAEQPTPIGDFEDLDLIFSPAGEEKQRRVHLRRKPNLDELHPIKSGKRLTIEEVLSQFVIKSVMQLAHVDGLTFDFLRALATELHQKGEMLLLGAGAKGNNPLVLREAGSAYRAFLYGEIDAEQRYKLLLLLSDQEFKLPESKSKDGEAE